MPKENTHLFIANQIYRNLPHSPSKTIIGAHIGHYYLGCIAPDTFYYHKAAGIQKIGDVLHGEGDVPTNELIFSMLDRSRSSRNERDLAFVFGYITHCVLDMTFHPIIYYFSGNFFDNDKKKRANAIYLHRHLETYLDSKFNDAFSVYKFVDARLADGLLFLDVLSERLNASKNEFKSALKMQRLYNRLFRNGAFSKTGFPIARHLDAIETEAGLFYENLKYDERKIEEEFYYQDTVYGANQKATLTGLIYTAIQESQRRIMAAFAYFSGSIPRNEALEIIRGESLETGKVGITAAGVRFTNPMRPELKLKLLRENKEMLSLYWEHVKAIIDDSLAYIWLPKTNHLIKNMAMVATGIKANHLSLAHCYPGFKDEIAQRIKHIDSFISDCRNIESTDEWVDKIKNKIILIQKEF